MKVAREILAHAREETLIGWWQIDWDAAGAGVSRFRALPIRRWVGNGAG
jgi:hypothetical protein